MITTALEITLSLPLTSDPKKVPDLDSIRSAFTSLYSYLIDTGVDFNPLKDVQITPVGVIFDDRPFLHVRLLVAKTKSVDESRFINEIQQGMKKLLIERDLGNHCGGLYFIHD